MDLDKPIDALAAKGLFFYTSIPSAGGSQTIGFMAEEAKAYARGPVATLAANLGALRTFISHDNASNTPFAAGKRTGPAISART